MEDQCYRLFDEQLVKEIMQATGHFVYNIIRGDQTMDISMLQKCIISCSDDIIYDVVEREDS